MAVPILQEWMVRAIKAYDPIGDVFWNRRLGSYVYCQRVPHERFLLNEYTNGIAGINGPFTDLHGVFEYKSSDGVRLEPTPIMTRCLLDTYTRRNDDPRNREFDEDQFEKPMDLAATPFDELMERDEFREYASDIRDYGFREKKHFVLDYVPGAPRKKLILPVGA